MVNSVEYLARELGVSIDEVKEMVKLLNSHGVSLPPVGLALYHMVPFYRIILQLMNHSSMNLKQVNAVCSLSGCGDKRIEKKIGLLEDLGIISKSEGKISLVRKSQKDE